MKTIVIQLQRLAVNKDKKDSNDDDVVWKFPSEL